MNEQPALPVDLTEQWLRFWSYISAPLNSVSQSAVVSAYLQDSSEAFNKAMAFWTGRPEQLAEITAGWAEDFNQLFMDIDPELNEPAELEKAISRVQSSIAEKIYRLIDETPELNESEKKILRFNLRQFQSIVDPQNALFGNSDVLKQAIETEGQSLVNGAARYQEDLNSSEFGLQIQRSETSSLKFGETIATCAGEVVFQNELIQLIHYQARGKKQFANPLLIIPPCINRYYILDLLPENSMVGWLLEQGHDVYTISWVNPGPDLADIGFGDYLDKGCLTALQIVTELSGSEKVNLLGYCIGGLMAALASATKKGQKHVVSLTLLTTMLDYADPGELGLFTSPRLLEAIRKEADAEGILKSDVMSTVFTFLREDQLFWNYVRRHYYLGEALPSNALMYWGQDGTHLPAKMAVDYLSGFYGDNCLLNQGYYQLGEEQIDLSSSQVPKYIVACETDHIAPMQSVLDSSELLSGKVRKLRVSGGHVLGVLNPPARGKGNYRVLGEDSSNEGSWWNDWQDWLTDFAGNKVESRPCANNDYPPIEKAPGSFVRL